MRWLLVLWFVALTALSVGTGIKEGLGNGVLFFGFALAFTAFLIVSAQSE